MSRIKKHKKGSCPACDGINVTKEIKKDLTKYTCVVCGFMYTLNTTPPRPVSEPDEKAGQLWDEH